MITVLRVELAKVFRKWRTFIGFIAIGVLIPTLIFALGAEGHMLFSFATQSLGEAFNITGNLMNGYTTTYIIFGMLFVSVPFLITLVAGDILAGEATAGTYRLIFTKPVSRSTIITAKWVASTIYAVSLVTLLTIMCLIFGISFLGEGEIIAIRSQVIIIPQAEALTRIIYAWALGCLAMTAVSSIAFMFSAFVDNAIGPIMTTMAVILVMTIISAIDIPLFDTIRPYFFTNHMSLWRHAFNDVVSWDRIATSSAVLIGHIVGTFTIVQIYMRRKDILT